jgi:hypothetical protein
MKSQENVNVLILPFHQISKFVVDAILLDVLYVFQMLLVLNAILIFISKCQLLVVRMDNLIIVNVLMDFIINHLGFAKIVTLDV